MAISKEQFMTTAEIIRGGPGANNRMTFENFAGRLVTISIADINEAQESGAAPENKKSGTVLRGSVGSGTSVDLAVLWNGDSEAKLDPKGQWGGAEAVERTLADFMEQYIV